MSTEIETEADPGVLTWRAWMSAGDGILRSPVSSGGRVASWAYQARTGRLDDRAMWAKGGHTASCWKNQHRAPFPDCNCTFAASPTFGI